MTPITITVDMVEGKPKFSVSKPWPAGTEITTALVDQKPPYLHLSEHWLHFHFENGWADYKVIQLDLARLVYTCTLAACDEDEAETAA